jgi:hypothetical protein
VLWDSSCFIHTLVLSGVLMSSCHVPRVWPSLSLDPGSGSSVTWLLPSTAAFPTHPTSLLSP